LNTRTTRSPFRRRIWPRAASGGYPRSPTTSVQVTHDVLRRRMLHTRDACDRFLPSAASISSTRVSFALDEVPASRLRTFSVPHSPRVRRRTFEHPAVSRRRGDCGGTEPDRSDPNHCRACRASSMRRLADLSAAAHVIEAAPRALTTRPVKTSPFCDPARLPSKGAFHRLASCDAHRAPLG